MYTHAYLTFTTQYACWAKHCTYFPMFTDLQYYVLTYVVSYLRAQKIQAPTITFYYIDRPQCLYVCTILGTGMKSAYLFSTCTACMHVRS